MMILGQPFFFLTKYPKQINRNLNVLSASLNKLYPSLVSRCYALFTECSGTYVLTPFKNMFVYCFVFVLFFC